MPDNLIKRDIVLDIYQKTNYQQSEVKEVVQLTLDAIAHALSSGQNIQLRNFGVFDIQVRKARIGRNPNKPEIEVLIPTRTGVKFKPGKELKTHLDSQVIAR